MTTTGWRVVHHDVTRDIYTLERTRPWFKGKYRVATGEQIAAGWPGP